jgi:hypothetical protein
MEFAVCLFERFADALDRLNDGELSSRPMSTLLVSPIRPIMVWNSPSEIYVASPMPSNHLQRLSRCSFVVPFFNTAIIFFLLNNKGCAVILHSL